jgi:hypothetical protein
MVKRAAFPRGWLSSLFFLFRKLLIRAGVEVNEISRK